MKKDSALKKRTINLRKQGLSYNEISKKTGIPKSTLSVWLKSTLLKPEYRARLYTKQIEILARGPKSQKERRKKEVEQIIQEAKKEIILPLSEQAFKLSGAALYWGEGTKGNIFQITNSDPRLIMFMARWIENMFGVSRANLKGRLNIYPQQNERDLKNFWSEITGIPVKNFGKTYIKPFSTGYKKNNLYYGTMRIEVPRSGNYLHRVYGWTEAILGEEGNKLEGIKKRWIRLTKTTRPVNLKT